VGWKKELDKGVTLVKGTTADSYQIYIGKKKDPRPVAASLAQLCRVDLVVTVVDGSAAADQAHLALFRHQLAAADLVLYIYVYI